MSSPTRPPADIHDQGSLGEEDFVQAASRLIEQQAYPDAARLCRQGLATHPQNNQGRLVLGLALLGLENHLDLLTEAEQAASFAPFEPLAHRLLGEALLALGRHGEARAALDQARELSSPDQPEQRLWVLLEQVCEGPRGEQAGATPAARNVQVMGEPESWGDPDDFTNIMDDPPALSASEAVDQEQSQEEEEDERYTTAPWLPPSYLERMRQVAADDDPEMYVVDDQTVSEELTPVPEELGGGLPAASFPGDINQSQDMLDDNDTVSLAEDYQELLQRAEDVPAGQAQESPVDDEETVSLPEGYRELLEAATADRARAEGESLLPVIDTPPFETSEGSGEHPLSEEEAIAALTGMDFPVVADLAAEEERGTEEVLSRPEPDQEDGLDEPTLAGQPLDSVSETAPEGDHAELYMDDDETGVGVDQELLLASMERAVQAPPRVQLHPEDDSSAALVDSGLLSEWGAAEASSVVTVPDEGEESGPTETTAAGEAPSFTPQALITDEQPEILEESLDVPGEPGWAEAELEEDEATVARGAEPLEPLEGSEEESAWGDVEEDPGEPTVAQISPMETDPVEALAEKDDDEQTVARGHDPLGPLDDEDEQTVARGHEPLGPLDEAEWAEDPGEPTVAQISPMAGEEEGAWAADDLGDEGEQTVVRDGPMAGVPAGESDPASGDVWGDQQVPRVPDQSTKPIDLQPGKDDLALGQIPLLSEVSMILEGELDDEGLELLDSEELSDISVEMVLEEDLPPLPPASSVAAEEGSPEEEWGAAAALPVYEDEQGFGDPYDYEEEEEEEEEYAEATQVRVDLPQLRARVSEELDTGGEPAIHALDGEADAEFPDDDSVQEEETGFYQEGSAEVSFPPPHDDQDPYASPGYGGDETPAGVEGFPGASYPYSQAPSLEAPAHLEEDPFASNLGDAPAYLEEEPLDPEPAAVPSAPAASPAATAEAPPYQPRVERTENLRASSPGPTSPQRTPVEVYDARSGVPEYSRGQPAPAPAPSLAPDPRRASMPGGSARLDAAARTGTNIVAMLKGRPGSKRLPLLIMSTVAVIVLAFGIGRVVRHMRLGDQIEEKRERAAKQLRAGNMLDYTAASQSYAEILKHRPEDMAAHWAQSRVQAAIPVEFGDPNPQASRRADQTGKPSEDRLAADIYAALFTGSLTRANKLLEEGRVARPEAAILAYLEGRVRMLEGKTEEALKELERAVTLEPSDTLFLLWRAEAQAELGMTQKSLNAHASTLKQNPNHVGTLIAQARLLLETKGDLGTAQKNLEDILSGARSSLSSKGQRGWAAALMARILLARGDMTRARTFLTKARTNQPTRDPLFLDQLAQAYLESYQAGEAERVIQESRDLLPGRPHPHFYLAQVYLLQGRSARALVSLRKARGLVSPAAVLLKARILFSLGRHQEALAEAIGVLDSHKGHLRASLLQAEILAAQGKGNEAEQSLLALLPANRRNVELLTTLGEVYLQIGRTHQARQRLGEAVRLDRFTFKARLKLAEVDLAEGKFSAAHKRLGDAARANLGNTVALRKLADLEFAMGNFPQARELYASLVKRSGNDPEVRLGFSRVLAAQHEDSQAETELRAAEARQADRTRVALVRGEFALAQGKASLAISQLAVATSGSKPTAEALHLQTRAHLMNNDEHSATGAVQRLSSLYPGSPEALDAAGRVEHYAGSFSRAVRTFGQAVLSLRTAPRPPLIHARALVMAGRAHQDNGRSDQAMPQYEEAARICPRCAEPHYRIGLVHDENERPGAAIASLRRAKSLDPKMKEVYYDLGSVLERASRSSEAAAAYKTYLSLNPPKELADAAKEALENLGQ